MIIWIDLHTIIVSLLLFDQHALLWLQFYQVKLIILYVNLFQNIIICNIIWHCKCLKYFNYMEVYPPWLPRYFGRNLNHESNCKCNVSHNLYPVIEPNIVLFPPGHEDVEMKYSFAFKHFSQDCVDCYITYKLRRPYRICIMMPNKHSILVKMITVWKYEVSNKYLLYSSFSIVRGTSFSQTY